MKCKISLISKWVHEQLLENATHRVNIIKYRELQVFADKQNIIFIPRHSATNFEVFLSLRHKRQIKHTKSFSVTYIQNFSVVYFFGVSPHFYVCAEKYETNETNNILIWELSAFYSISIKRKNTFQSISFEIRSSFAQVCYEWASSGV